MIYSNIKENKVSLMGLATCLIILFHTPGGKSIFDIGVDIFLFLSGFGCACSLSKEPRKKYFYTKRIVRILPAYLIVIIAWKTTHYILNGGGSCSDFIYDVFFLNFFIDGDLYWWYIPVALCYYLILPFYIQRIMLNKYVKYIPHVIVLFSFLLIICEIRFPQEFLWLRITPFLLGANMFVFPNEDVNKGCLVLFVACCALAACYYVIEINNKYYALKYLIYSPIVWVIVQRFSIPKNALLSFCGAYSLEMYLLHPRILWFYNHLTHNYYLLLCVSFFTAIIASFLLKRVLFLMKIDRLPHMLLK